MATRSATKGFAAWKAALHRQERQVKQGAKSAVQHALDANMGVSYTLTPVKTGYLKSRNRERWVERGPYRYTGEYYNDAPYAGYVALGTYKMKARDFVTPGFYRGCKTFEDYLRIIL